MKPLTKKQQQRIYKQRLAAFPLNMSVRTPLHLKKYHFFTPKRKGSPRSRAYSRSLNWVKGAGWNKNKQLSLSENLLKFETDNRVGMLFESIFAIIAMWIPKFSTEY